MIATTFESVLAASVAAVFCTAVGFPIARLVLPRAVVLPAAPALGFAAHSAAALPVFLLFGFSRTTVAAVAIAALMVAGLVAIGMVASDRRAACLRAASSDRETTSVRAVLALVLAAALLAVVPAAAVAPKISDGAVLLSAPIFDHAKVAIIDGIVRLGLPPANPFFGEQGEAGRLAYYYLWHVAAAELSAGLGITGWAADIGLTWFSAFASLGVMMGVAARLSGRMLAAALVLPLAAAGSMRPVVSALLGGDRVAEILDWPSGFSGWMFQSAWVPQHLSAASTAVLAVLVLPRLAERRGIRRDLATVVTLALLIAASFALSTWIGAVVLPPALVVACVVLLWRAAPADRPRLLALAAVAGAAALVLAAPLIVDQLGTVGARGNAAPLVLRPFPVLNAALNIPETLHRALDLAAYWLIELPIELPAIYPAGLAAMAIALFARRSEPGRSLTFTLVALGGVGLLVPWLIASTLGDNNDLGLRAVLPAVLILTGFAAAGLAEWLSRGQYLAAAAALAALALALPDTVHLVRSDLAGTETASSRALAGTAEMWAAVRRHAGPAERIANNPLFLADLTPWPVNLSWALLANRSSCFPGRELALAYAPLPPARRDAIDAQFVRVFAGTGTAEDIFDLAERSGCRVAVVTPQDGAWTRDLFAASPLYRLAEEQPGRWRIYRRSDVAADRPRS
ncbi:MAG: hypothetical protein HXX10_23630 [Rhodoplanes sp.]|uniref:hypothetical protein n=1 Tax=Rhodoplanes sp. TaxID=1968906 RepID=UPI001843479B|nr:hypothetical protein [Rhodoplanes sp.]NVO17027.1 hypothetical protein [Rhodoplanes sp.]